MGKNLFFTFLLFFITFLLVAPSSAENITYYSPEGKVITKSEYEEMIGNQKKEISKMASSSNQHIRRKTKSRTPKIGGDIEYPSGTFTNLQAYDEKGRPTNDPRYLDSKGRPIYNNEGWKYVYAEDEADMRANEKAKRNRPIGGLFMTFGPNESIPTGTMSYRRSSEGLVPVWTPSSR